VKLESARARFILISQLLFFFYLLFGSPVFSALAQIQFEPLALRQGLSQVTVNFIQQDFQGYIWVGTDDGLNLYDGYGFRVFTNTPFDPNSLSDNNIKACFEDEKGTVWVGTFAGGLNRFNRHEETFTHFLNHPDNPQSLSHNSVFGITGDSKTLFVFTPAGGVDLFFPETETFYKLRFQAKDPSSLTDDRVTTGIRTANGDVWIGTQNGLNHVEHGSLKVHQIFFEGGDNDDYTTNRVSSLALGPNEGVWVGLVDGRIARLDSGNQLTWLNQNKPLISPNKPITALHEDRFGTLWFGSTQGELFKWDETTLITRRVSNNSTMTGQRRGLPIIQIIQDRNDGIWAVWASMGIFHLDSKTEQLSFFTHEPGYINSLNTDTVRQVYEDEAGIIWISTGDNGVNRYDPQKSKFPRKVKDPFKTDSLGSSHCNGIIRNVLE